jgi:hypothetical protein
MIDRVAEVNRVLLATAALADGESRAEKKAVIRQCEGTVIEGRIPDHESSIEYAKQIGLLKIDGKYVILTFEGRSFLDINPGELYDLSEDQKKFLIRSCYLHGVFREECAKILSGFSPSYGHGTYRWSWTDDPPLDGDTTIMEHLRELELLIRRDTYYEVNAEYVDTVAIFLAEGKGFTEEKFLTYLREKEAVADIAECIVLENEARRLREKGHVAEAMSIRSISKLRVNAGYDVESYNGKSKGVKYDRFIEVKGSRDSKVRFFWTDNEIRVAREFGTKYWIYFQGGIDLKVKKAKNKLLMFENPIETILNDGRFIKLPQGLIVEANLRGEILAVT